MVYQWAVFRHQRPILGAGCELFVVILAFLSIALPLIYEESLLMLGISSGLAIICFILFLLFAQSDKLRRSMSN
ncbi:MULTISPECIES: hypothetical protein [Vibrio]|jgi:hypothetical protein|uniref:hypothetical protein n=1 Tax=Vibrio TaxID=662 RepID=UPI00063A7CFA|nr:hypothetical protein [Vibrio crassostreae]KPL97058.1 hypothetical protein AN167_24650 [Vibrio splendidus]CAH6780646.1 conserved hypothetical protein [Vibrio chagasii]NOH77877.1 hypothetical protein [Vibrio crassostreae]PMM12143.1 hypothetical protein BCT62_25750 [Vibrio splendidus]PMN35140.1 hypothetical protein BCT36_00400 [Vibrio splendidus]